MKKISLLTLSVMGLALLGISQLEAGLQGNRVLPDRLDINNNTQQVIKINNTDYRPGETTQINADRTGVLELKVGNNSYTLLYPTANENELVMEVFSPVRYNASDIIAGRTIDEGFSLAQTPLYE